MSALELHGIVAGYEEARDDVLRGISVRVESGSVTAVLGPNGAGKTTLLNVALGWHAPREGRVELDRRRLGEIPRDERGRLLSLVPQWDHIPFEYSVLEYVLLGRAPYIGRLELPSAADMDVARAAIADAGLAGRESDGVLETSAGERELILLARSLAQDPAFLLMDEPSAHLDLANKRRLAGLIRREAERRRGVLLTAHEPEFAAAVADRIILLRDGAILAQGAPDAVMTAERLSATYDVAVEVVDAGGRRVFLW